MLMMCLVTVRVETRSFYSLFRIHLHYISLLHCYIMCILSQFRAKPSGPSQTWRAVDFWGRMLPAAECEVENERIGAE